MRRRSVIAGLLASVALPGLLRAQQRADPVRIGYLDSSGQDSWFNGLLRGLAELGYVENRTIVIERRSPRGRFELIPSLAAELVRLQPRLIVASSPPSALAAQAATLTIPIVMTNVTDPVALGLITSLAHPGKNITGIANQSAGSMGKRLELLVEVAGHSRMGVVWVPGLQGNQANYRELQAAAAAMRLPLESFEMERPDDIEIAFRAAAARACAVIVLNSVLALAHRDSILAAATRHRVPAIYFDTEWAAAGGLMSFGSNIPDLHRRAAIYVDRILKGAAPAELAVEQATKFDLVLNMKTARALDLRIPQSILVRADEVIE